jgi:hypothetical protein
MARFGVSAICTALTTLIALPHQFVPLSISPPPIRYTVELN